MMKFVALTVLAMTIVVSNAAPVIYSPSSVSNVTSSPDGTYEGSVPFIIDVSMAFNIDTVDVDINVKVAHQTVKCPGEPFDFSGGTVSFPNISKTGDCMGDALRGQHKDPSKYTMTQNGDGSLTFHSGFPDLKLKQQVSTSESDSDISLYVIYYSACY